MFRLAVFIVLVLARASTASVSDRENDGVVLRDGRIVGGEVTDISENPHVISLRVKSCATCAFNHLCSGSIYNSTVILTAAHCLLGQAKYLHVIAGSSIRNGYGVMVPVESYSIHENYSKETLYENDIGILFLGTELPLDHDNIKPVELATEVPNNGVISTITGWGATTKGGYASDELLEVNVPIVSNDICEERYENEGLINNSMLCAGSTKGGVDACKGDSGSPLLVDGVLAGIVSWGFACGSPQYPRVFANVAYLRPWINKTLS